MRRPNTIQKYNGRRIASRRLEKGLSQDELAENLGVSRFTIIRFEQGQSSNLSTLQRICDYLGIPVAEVFLTEAA